MDPLKSEHSKATLKTLQKVVEQQEKFFQSTQLTLALLKAYQRNSNNLLVIGEKLAKEVDLDKEDPKYIEECFDDIGTLAAFGDIFDKKEKRYIGFEGNGLFTVINIVPKKEAASVQELIDHVNAFAADMI